MTGVLFLLIAFGLSVGGSVLLWLRHRAPTSLDHGIDSFRREMRALAPEGRPKGDPQHGDRLTG